jgi:hypothetical protein
MYFLYMISICLTQAQIIYIGNYFPVVLKRKFKYVGMLDLAALLNVHGSSANASIASQHLYSTLPNSGAFRKLLKIDVLYTRARKLKFL